MGGGSALVGCSFRFARWKQSQRWGVVMAAVTVSVLNATELWR